MDLLENLIYIYISLLNITKLKDAIAVSKDTATGPDMVIWYTLYIVYFVVDSNASHFFLRFQYSFAVLSFIIYSFKDPLSCPLLACISVSL